MKTATRMHGWMMCMISRLCIYRQICKTNTHYTFSSCIHCAQVCGQQKCNMQSPDSVRKIMPHPGGVDRLKRHHQDLTSESPERGSGPWQSANNQLNIKAQRLCTRRHIFCSFRQRDSSTTERVHNTGHCYNEFM